MKNILLNSIKFLTGVFVVTACNMIAANTVYFGVAVACWFGVAVGAYSMLDSIKSVLIKK